MARGEEHPLIQIEGAEERVRSKPGAPIQVASLQLPHKSLAVRSEGRQHGLPGGQASLRGHHLRSLGLVASVRKGGDQEGIGELDLGAPQGFPRARQRLGNDLVLHHLLHGHDVLGTFLDRPPVRRGLESPLGRSQSLDGLEETLAGLGQQPVDLIPLPLGQRSLGEGSGSLRHQDGHGKKPWKDTHEPPPTRNRESGIDEGSADFELGRLPLRPGGLQLSLVG